MTQSNHRSNRAISGVPAKLTAQSTLLTAFALCSIKTWRQLGPEETFGPWRPRVLGWLEFPNLFEVQRPKNQHDLTAIAATFQPYLQARDWITIQKETP